MGVSKSEWEWLGVGGSRWEHGLLEPIILSHKMPELIK